MLAHYVRTALRTLRRRPGYTAMNAGGLAVGLAAALLIALYVRHEWSYDRYHEHAAQLYRVTLEQTTEGSAMHRAVGPPALGPALDRSFPELETVARLGRLGPASFQIDDRIFTDQRFAFADPALFSVFSLPFVQGSPDGLRQPDAIVLTESATRRFFGKDDPIGRRIHIALGQVEADFHVAGVIEDVPENTHFDFDLLTSHATVSQHHPYIGDDQWRLFGDYTYVRLAEDADPERFEEKLTTVTERHMRWAKDRGVSYDLHLRPVTQIHLRSHLESEWAPNGDARQVAALALIALLIVLVASINYVNLATAYAAERVKEVSVRKTLGAHRRQIARQYLAEAVLVTLAAAVLGLGLAQLGLPVLNMLAGTAFSFGSLLAGPLLLGLLVVLVAVGIGAGSYPAFYLAAHDPQRILKGGRSTRGTREATLRSTLVGVQFAISLVLLIGAAGIHQQLQFMLHAPAGYERDHVVAVQSPSILGEGLSPEALRDELEGHPDIGQVTYSTRLPTEMDQLNSEVIPEGSASSQLVLWNPVHAAYATTLGIEIVAGRDFNPLLASDTSAFLINEAAARAFGWSDPVGKTLRTPRDGEVMGTVRGILRDFHHQSFRETIEPAVFFMAGWPLPNVLVRLAPGSEREALAFLEQRWQTWSPDRAFDYTFLDESHAAQYEHEQRLGRLIALFAGIATLIACVGLFGLTAFTTSRRTKELGVRKVLGASVRQLLGLLARDALRPLAVAFVLITPVAYLVLRHWLNGFAYHVGISWPLFALVGLIMLAIALLSVSYHTLRAALTDPVESLRYE